MNLSSLLRSDRSSPQRARLLAGFIGAAFALVAMRGAQLSLFGSTADASTANETAQAETRRVDILDRHGERLATSVSVYSLYADPGAIWDARQTATALKTVLPRIDEAAIAARLSDKSKKFVWIERQLTPALRQKIFELGLDGIGFREETKRLYPRGSLAGHVLGFAGVDGNGLAGIEYAMDETLRTSQAPVRLTIDASVQFSLETELANAASGFQAKGAAGIVLDARSGEVLAMAWLMLDPNRGRFMDASARTNRATGAVYELGSVFKPLTVAAGLDVGILTMNDTFNVADPVRIGPETIRDDHPLPDVTRAGLTDIIAYSSNIGTVRAALMIGSKRQEAFLKNLGLLEASPVELAGSERPIPPARWDDITVATVGFGHGIAITPMAFASAFATLANKGEYVPPTLLADPDPLAEPRISRSVMRPETAAAVNLMLRDAVTRGTGRSADVPGYRIAGKTGTAEKLVNGQYSQTANVTSFAALFPFDAPRYVVVIVMDEPQGETRYRATAAWNAAPTAGRVIERIAPLLEVSPYFEDLETVSYEATTVSLRSQM